MRANTSKFDSLQHASLDEKRQLLDRMLTAPTPEAELEQLAESLTLEALGELGGSGSCLASELTDAQLEAEFEVRWPEMERQLEQRLSNLPSPTTPAVSPGFSRPVALWRSDATFAREFAMEAHCSLEDYLGDPLDQVARHLEDTGWSDVAIHLPDAQQCVLERVVASKSTTAYAVRYAIQGPAEPGVHLEADIEVDIFRKGFAERISGGRRDPRYNRSLYEALGHRAFVDRVFTPLVLARNLESWSLDQDVIRWVQQRSCYFPLVPPSHLPRTIGTLSVSNRSIASDRLVQETLHYVATQASLIARSATMAGLAEGLLASLRDASGALHGAIHVGHSVDSIFAGVADRVRIVGTNCELSRSGGVADAPRPGGIGAEAVKRGEPLLFRLPELARRNAKLASMGIQASLVAPLTSARGTIIGVAYLHFDEPPSRLPPSEVFDTCGYVLGAALRVNPPLRWRADVVAEAERFLSGDDEPRAKRMQRMANFANNVLGSDHVSIVVNDSVRHAGRYVTGPGISGGAAARAALNDQLRTLGSPLGEIFIEDGSAMSPQLARGRFAHDQRVRATAVLPLRYESTRVGTFVVDFRSAQQFGEAKRMQLRKLAELFAAGLVAAAPGVATSDLGVPAEDLSPRRREPLESSNVLFTSCTHRTEPHTCVWGS